MPIRHRKQKREQQAIPTGVHGRAASIRLSQSRVSGRLQPVLAKHSKHFSLEYTLSIGVDRMQGIFEPMRQQVES